MSHHDRENISVSLYVSVAIGCRVRQANLYRTTLKRHGRFRLVHTFRRLSNRMYDDQPKTTGGERCIRAVMKEIRDAMVKGAILDICLVKLAVHSFSLLHNPDDPEFKHGQYCRTAPGNELK